MVAPLWLDKKPKKTFGQRSEEFLFEKLWNICQIKTSGTSIKSKNGECLEIKDISISEATAAVRLAADKAIFWKIRGIKK